ncbi:MAG: hypothetical protein GY719_26265 [bacterium]|nr:hypothetical protein [bacterium]
MLEALGAALTLIGLALGLAALPALVPVDDEPVAEPPGRTRGTEEPGPSLALPDAGPGDLAENYSAHLALEDLI